LLPAAQRATPLSARAPADNRGGPGEGEDEGLAPARRAEGGRPSVTLNQRTT
jgi:hypothetical protein